jgi:putative DNA primase/helicase
MDVDMFDLIDPSGTSRLDVADPTTPPEEKFEPMVPLTGIAKDKIHHFSLGHPSAIWPYHNNNDLLEGYVCRFETTNQDGSPGKEFRPYRYGALSKNGQTKVGWHWKGWDEKRPLYGLDELRDRPNAPVLVVEGEKKVDAANRLFPDYVAVSSMNGAQSPHKSDWTPVAGRDVVIWPDHDEPGRKFAEAVTRLAANAGAASVAVVSIPAEWPESWDLADRPPDGAGHDVLVAMLKSAKPRDLPRSPGCSKPQKKPASEAEITSEVCRLVKLSRVKYELEREGVAGKLAIRVTTLDRLVKVERDELDLRRGDDEKAAGSGRPLDFPEIDPWSEPVDGAELFADLSNTIRNYVILTQAQADGVALWVMQTHLFDATEVAAKLLIKSPERRSGKSRLLELLGHLVVRPQPTANIKAATLFRVIEQCRPTLLLDEVDTYLKTDPELHGIINSGFNKAGAKVLRAVPVGDNWAVHEFSTWCPQAIAGIGHMPDTIVDRSFVIEMKRKLPTEKVAKLRRRDAGSLIDLARKAARWAADHLTELKDVDSEMPECLNDRAADAWEFCIAIADLVGGEWPVRARTAARELSGDRVTGNESTRVQLLADIRDLFDETGHETLFSWEIVKGLVAMSNRPWAEWGRDKKPITATAMSRLLSDLLPPGVTPGTVWKSGKSDKGYHRADLEDPFARYLPQKSLSKTSVRQDPQESSGFRHSRNVRMDPGLTFSKTPKAAESAVPDGLTFSNPRFGEKRADGTDLDDRGAVLDGPATSERLPWRGRL